MIDMRHFSDFERELIRIIVQTESTERQVFGDLICKKVFLSGKCALWMRNDEKQKCSIFFSKDTSSFKSNLAKLVDVLALIKYLEKEGLVYLCEIPTNNYWLYEDTKQIEQDEGVVHIPEQSGSVMILLACDFQMLTRFFRSKEGHFYKNIFHLCLMITKSKGIMARKLTDMSIIKQVA